jgi:hypothetical protein
VLGEIRGGGPVWDVESGGPVGVLVADCPRPQSRARLKPKTMTVTFEEFSPTHDFFDYTRYRYVLGLLRERTATSPARGAENLRSPCDWRKRRTGSSSRASMFSWPYYGCPFAPLGTCEVMFFRKNSRIRFDTASAPKPAKPLTRTNEPPRSEAG